MRRTSLLLHSSCFFTAAVPSCSPRLAVDAHDTLLETATSKGDVTKMAESIAARGSAFWDALLDIPIAERNTCLSVRV